MSFLLFPKIEIKDIKLGSNTEFYSLYIYLIFIKKGFRDFLKPFFV
tara:strand:+ start:4199 stop:4336 length:138 start_codon:yes stop_codon:yes gene_type:complete